MDDFKNLLEESKKHNIDIMIDIVFNHSSTQNPWFKQSYEDYVSNNTSLDSKADWYCWIDHYQTGYSIYTGSKGIYYESRFDHSMPDLNTQNEAVRAEMLKILKYWVEKGVDGFRFDAVKYFDFNNTKYNEVYSYMTSSNVASYSLAKSLGMEKIKEYKDNHEGILFVYCIQRSKWEDIKNNK
jgi:alpha-amylase